MIYEIHCHGHGKSFRSAGGCNSRGRYFCGGCQKRPLSKFLSDCHGEKGARNFTDLVDSLQDFNLPTRIIL